MFPLCFVVCILTAVRSLEFDVNFSDKLPDGERLYKELVRKSESYGDCWKRATSDLRVGCKSLTEEVQSRLAIAFSNCFLISSGFEACPCADDSPIADCLQNCDDRVFSTYTEFFTHTHGICHYLQHREWQEEASRTVLLLTKNSQAVTKKLEEASKSQERILEFQRAGREEQRKLISHSRVLKTELQISRESARTLYHQFKSQTHEQSSLLLQVFDRVKDLQNFVLGEFTGVYTVVYYVIATILVYVLTSMPSTAQARIWGMFVISANAAAEKYVVAQTLPAGLQVDLQDTHDLMYSRIWLCRKMACLICLVVLVKFHYCFRDYNAINNKLLREIQQQNKELENFIRGLGFHENIRHSSVSAKLPVDSPVSVHENSNGRIDQKTGTSEVELNLKSASIPLRDLSNGFVNKENDSPLTPFQVSQELKSKLKKVVKKEVTSRRKKEPSAPALPYEEKTLPNSESPVVRTYNLRRSSRLNSPVSPVGALLSPKAF